MQQNIMLVDDDEDEFIIFSEALEQTGQTAECSFFSSAESALMEVDKSAPDCILVDMNMPRVNGLQCIRQLVAKLKNKNTPIFIYSTNMNEQLCSQAISAGASGCIKKTSSIAKLSTVIKEILDGILARDHYTGNLKFM